MATGNMHKKFGKDWTCISGSMLADRRTHIQTHTQTDRQTHRHGHHNTPLPYWGHSNNVEYVDCIDWAANLGTYVPKSAPTNGVSKQSNNSQCLMSCRL